MHRIRVGAHTETPPADYRKTLTETGGCSKTAVFLTLCGLFVFFLVMSMFMTYFRFIA